MERQIFDLTQLGKSHEKSGKPCQDSASSYKDEENQVYIGTISDGHGSDTYFRSDLGAEFLTEITVESIQKFVEDVDSNMLPETFTQKVARTTEIVQNEISETSADTYFRGLFASIIAQWNDKIYQHWESNKPEENELRKRNIPEKIIPLFLKDENIEFAYGCTLIAFAITKEYWFAFQIGDGTCVIFDNKAEWSEPIPWDNKCSGSTTTSICEKNALDSFRYCYGKEKFPSAIFVASDGFDGVYGDITLDRNLMEYLAIFYNRILRSLVKNGYDSTIKELEQTLPKMTSDGISRDDMSIAAYMDMNDIANMNDLLFSYEIKKEQKIADAEKIELNKKEEEIKKEKQIISEKELMLKQAEERIQEIVSEIKEEEGVVNRILKTYNEIKEKLTNARAQKEFKEDELSKARQSHQSLIEEIKFHKTTIERLQPSTKKLQNRHNNILTKLKKLNEERLGLLNNDISKTKIEVDNKLEDEKKKNLIIRFNNLMLTIRTKLNEMFSMQKNK